MDDDRTASSLTVGLFVVVGLLVLYLGAFGPLVRWAPPAAFPALRSIYQPILWAHDTRLLHDPLEWYAELWRD
ncbi:MAG: hypothetical protein AB7S26_40470 [Sandaracinaceae bacterium]